MATIIDNSVRNTRQVKKSTPSFLEKLNIKGKLEKRKLVNLWEWRNHDHGELFATSLEVDYIVFDQNIFIEETEEIVSKLRRLNFVVQENFPDEKLFKDFSYVMYDQKHNLAITLYNPIFKTEIKTAYDIMIKSKFNGSSGRAVFLASLNVLAKK